MTEPGVSLVAMSDMSIAFGGIKAVDYVTVNVYPGEVMGLLGMIILGKTPAKAA